MSTIDRFLRMPEVNSITGLSRAQIYSLAAKGTFPKPYKLGERASGWLESEIKTWIESRTSVQGDTDQGVIV